MKKSNITILGLFGFLLLIPFFFQHVIENIWGILTEQHYIIPSESSLMNFHVTVSNPGSGDWWLYAEDDTYYYSTLYKKHVPYVSFEKVAAATCKGFDPKDISTWCLETKP